MMNKAFVSLSALALVAAPTIAAAAPVANPAAALSVGNGVRAGTATKKSSALAGGGLIAVILGAAVVAGGVIIAVDDDDSDSN